MSYRKQYKNAYQNALGNYPDLLSVQDLQKILGGISSKAVVKLLKQGCIKYFYIWNKYQIPKVAVVDYLTGKSIVPYKPPHIPKQTSTRRKPGTGCLYQINDHLWEGKYSPRNAHGKRISRNVYAQTRTECEEKLMMLIAQMNREIIAERLLMNACSETP